MKPPHELRLKDQSGVTQVMLGAMEADTGLTLSQDGEPRVMLTVGPRASSTISVSGEKGKAGLLAGVKADGDLPFFMLRNGKGTPRFFVGLGKEPTLWLEDESGSRTFDASRRPEREGR